MVTKVLAILKSPKIIAYIVSFVALVVTIWYGVNLHSENDRMESELQDKTQKIVNLQNQMEAKERQFENTLSNYEQTTNEYIEELEQSKTRISSLQSTLRESSNEIQECLNLRVPDHILDRMRENTDRYTD